MRVELNFLTEDPVKIQICQDYWARQNDEFVMTAREVATKHNMKYSSLAKEIAEWCQAYSPDDSCAQCHERFRIYGNRSEYSQRVAHKTSWVCRVCEANNRAAERQREVDRLEQVRQFFADHDRGVICFRNECLTTINSLEQIVALLSLIRLGATEQLSYITPLWKIGQHKLSPTSDYDLELIKSLAESDILHPNVEQSSHDSFIFENDQFTGSYYLNYVAWNFPLVIEPQTDERIDDPQYLIREIERVFLNMNWPESWNDEWVPLWRRIGLEECLQYLDLCMREHGFEFSSGPKTHEVLSNALTSFSVAQTFNFIWGAARDAAAYYMRERIPKQQAANSVVGSIQRRIERARAEGWDIKAFGRDRRCPQTMISQILFNTVLHIGEEGFVTVPGTA